MNRPIATLVAFALLAPGAVAAQESARARAQQMLPPTVYERLVAMSYNFV